MKKTEVISAYNSVDDAAQTLTFAPGRKGRIVGISISGSASSPTASVLGTYHVIVQKGSAAMLPQQNPQIGAQLAWVNKTQYHSTLSVSDFFDQFFHMNYPIAAQDILTFYWSGSNGRLTAAILVYVEFD